MEIIIERKNFNSIPHRQAGEALPVAYSGHKPYAQNVRTKSLWQSSLHIILPFYKNVFGPIIFCSAQKAIVVTEKIDVSFFVFPIVRKESGVKAFFD